MLRAYALATLAGCFGLAPSLKWLGILEEAPVGNVWYVDGEYVDSDAAQLPADDLAVLRGYGIFDFTRTYGGRPFRLDAHLQRLQRSAELVLLELPLSLAEIRNVALETLARNGYPGRGEARLRLVVTGGASPDDITPAGESRLLALVTPFAAQPAERYRDGIKVVTNPQARPLPEAKTIEYVSAIMAQRRARQAGAVEAIYLNAQGHALEGTTTNLFAVLNGRLVAPVDGILYGVTRQAVLELAAARMPVEQRALPLEELLRADEVFITSSSKEVCPVRQVDDTTIGPPGSHTRNLMQDFSELAAASARGA